MTDFGALVGCERRGEERRVRISLWALGLVRLDAKGEKCEG